MALAQPTPISFIFSSSWSDEPQKKNFQPYTIPGPEGSFAVLNIDYRGSVIVYINGIHLMWPEMKGVVLKAGDVLKIIRSSGQNEGAAMVTGLFYKAS